MLPLDEIQARNSGRHEVDLKAPTSKMVRVVLWLILIMVSLSRIPMLQRKLTVFFFFIRIIKFFKKIIT